MDNLIIKNAWHAWVNAQNQTIDYDFAQSRIFQLKKVEGFIGVKGETLYIGFQGTADLHDALHDINIFSKAPFGDNKKVRIHLGFLNQFSDIEDFIIQTAIFYKNIVISGQSLGGCLAEIAAMYIKRFNKNINLKVVTWGKPKVFNTAGKEYYDTLNIETISYVYRNDMVPKLPPLFFEYTTNPIVYGEALKWWEKLLSGGNPIMHSPANYMQKFQEEILK